MTVGVHSCSSAAELQRSLEIDNEARPHRAVSADDVTASKEGAIATVEFLGAVDGVDAGSAAAAFEASRTNLVAMLVTVLPEHPRAGFGSAPSKRRTRRASRSRGRGYGEHAREDGLELILADVVPNPPAPPAGVEIIRPGERPELRAASTTSRRTRRPTFPEPRTGCRLRSSDSSPHICTRRDLRRARRRRSNRLREARRARGSTHGGSPHDGGASACGPSSTHLPTGCGLPRSSRSTTCRVRGTT